MEFILEGKSHELKVNGYFMKKYYEQFKGNVLIDVAIAFERKDMLRMAQLTYCATKSIDGTELKMTFDEWLNSFEDPFFLIYQFNNIYRFMMGEMKPTVDFTGEEDPKKNEQKPLKASC